jgi:transposase
LARGHDGQVVVSVREVVMARPASVFVRDLLPEEAQRLRRVSRQSKVFALRQRAQILLASDARSTAPEIARVLQTDENQVRRVIAEFNADGMVSLRPRMGGGRPRRIDDAAREEIRGIALARPRDLGEPGTRWSLTTLRRYLVRHRVVAAISKEHLRRLLGSMGITAQRTRTWKWSNDPLFEVKKSWVLAAYQAAEAGTLDGVVVSFDECGPISLKPHAGSGWFPAGRPARQRATYHRHSGTRKLLGAYDVGADRLWGHVESRPVTGGVVWEFLRDIRRRYPPDVTVYIVMDNLSAHWTPEIRRWATDTNVGLLPTPTNASHLNRIECHFWAYTEFVIKGSDYRDWTEFTKATHAYLRRRNRDRHDPRIIELENRRKVA